MRQEYQDPPGQWSDILSQRRHSSHAWDTHHLLHLQLLAYGHVRLNDFTLRVDNAGPLVDALGNVSSAFSGGSQTLVIMEHVNFDHALRAAESGCE